MRTLRQVSHTRGGAPLRQRGVTLAVILMLLIGVTVVALTSLQTGLLEMVMAGNEEARVAAFQKAQAGIDAAFPRLVQKDIPLVRAHSLDIVRCTPGMDSRYPDIECDVYDVVFTPEFQSSPDRPHTDVALRTVSYSDSWSVCDRLQTGASQVSSGTTTVDRYLVELDGRYQSPNFRGGRGRVVQAFCILFAS